MSFLPKNTQSRFAVKRRTVIQKNKILKYGGGSVMLKSFSSSEGPRISGITVSSEF